MKNGGFMLKKAFISPLIIAIMILLLTGPVFAFPPSDGPIYQGIDVSEWQGDIDFRQVADSGIDVVYIRASEGTGYVDPYFMQNYLRAKDNNLRVGVYHFLTATSVEEAEREANFFVSNIKGLQIDCKLAMDFEIFDGLGNEEINDISSRFLETVEELSGKECLIYSDAYNARTVFSEQLAERYPIWVADYFVDEPEDNGKWDTWVGFQYSDVGDISGIDGSVDLDKFTGGVFLNDKSRIPQNTASAPEQSFKYITVQYGDTLSQIAHQYNTSYQYLSKINDIPNPNLIYVNQVIKVPVLSSNETHETSHILYSVQRGNTLTGISLKYGVSIESIVKLNGISNPNLIYVGQILRIPTINN